MDIDEQPSEIDTATDISTANDDFWESMKNSIHVLPFFIFN